MKLNNFPNPRTKKVHEKKKLRLKKKKRSRIELLQMMMTKQEKMLRHFPVSKLFCRLPKINVNLIINSFDNFSLFYSITMDGN